MASPALSLRTFDELIAGIPALLGHTPTESIIVVVLEDRRRVGPLMRVDLPPTGPGPREIARHLARALATHGSARRLRTAFVVIVSGRGAWQRLAGELTRALTTVGIGAQHVYHVPQIAAAAPSRCLCGCAHRGVLADPSSSAVAVAHAVHEGRSVYPSRAALAAALTSPVDPATLRRRAREIRACRRPLAELVAEATAMAQAGRLTPPPEAGLIAAGAALLQPAGRDALIGWTATLDRAPAAVLDIWIWLTQQLPAPARASAAALCAIAALLAGDGAMANVALELAEDTVPGLMLTALLRQCAAAGMSPAQLRRVATTLR